MVSTDPIADMLTRIRNAIAVNKNSVNVPYSKLKQTIAEQLKANNYIEDVTVDGEGTAKVLRIVMNEPGTPYRITSIARVSKPGRRIYSKADEIPKIKNGRGIIIVSTSKGLMTGDQAESEKVGGELICRVY